MGRKKYHLKFLFLVREYRNILDTEYLGSVAGTIPNAEVGWGRLRGNCHLQMTRLARAASELSWGGGRILRSNIQL